MTHPYRDVLTEADLASMREALTPNAIVALDIETTGLDPHAEGASIVSLSLTLKDERTWVLPLDHPDGTWGSRWRHTLGLVSQLLLKFNTRIIAHNAQFDLRWIATHAGVDLAPRLYWDTMAMAHLLNENQSKRLKALAAPLMGGDWGIDVTAARSVPWFTLARYNALDTIATLRLWRQQYAVFSTAATDMIPLAMRTVMPAARALTRASDCGLLLDEERASAALTEAGNEVYAASKNLRARARGYGLDPEADDVNVSWEATSKWFLAFTEAAVERGDLIVGEMTGTGRPSWRSGVLTRLARQGYPVAQEILDYRHGSKQAQFLRAWIYAADHRGRVHATFNIARTSTGRLSSSDPNLQQVARDLKPVWRATEGRWLVEIDYSQVELRVAAEFIHRTVLPDNPMLQAYRDGLDLHRINATLVTGGAVDEVTKEERQKGKAVSFGFIFGMGVAKFVTYADESYGVEVSLEEAKRVRMGYFDTWKGLAEWHDYQRTEAHDQGYVTNLFGRRRRLPEVFTGDDYAVSQAQRQAINAPVQSTASDLMLHSLGRMDREGITIVGTVHDSVLLEVAQGDMDTVERACAIMLDSPVTLSVPLEVEASIGTHWGEYETTITRSTR